MGLGRPRTDRTASGKMRLGKVVPLRGRTWKMVWENLSEFIKERRSILDGLSELSSNEPYLFIIPVNWRDSRSWVSEDVADGRK